MYHLHRSTLLLLTAIALLAMPLPSHSYAPDYYARSSRLSHGRWIKVRVNDTGMQEIGYQQLRELGFADPEKVAVYGYGGVRLLDNEFTPNLPDDLPATPVLHTGEKLIFYGESDVRNDFGNNETNVSIRRNPYSRGGYYFLTDQTDGDTGTIPVAPYLPPKPYVTIRDYHTSISVYEQELTCPAQAGTGFFGEDLTKDPEFTHSVTVESPYAQTATLRFGFAAISGSTVSLSLQLPPDITLSSSYTARADGVYPNDHNYYNSGNGYHTFKLRDGDDQSYTATPVLRSTTPIEYAALDYIALIYRRHNSIADSRRMRMAFFNPTGSSVFRIQGTTANTHAWDVTDPLDIYTYELHPSETSGAMDASFSKGLSLAAYVEVFDDNIRLLTPETAGEIPNQDLHALEVPDMLIVTSSAMRPYAEEVAALHRTHQGMTVHVVDQEQAFNEFSSGTPHPMGIRRLAKMFHDRDPEIFRYLLLYGGGSYDNRGILLPTEGYMLTYQCDSRNEMNNASTAYCTDSYFGMLSDGYDHQHIYFEDMSVAVGRIPVLNTGDAANVNRKIRHYFENPPSAPAINRMLLMADAGDQDTHVKQIEEVADTIAKYSPGTTMTKAYNSLYPLTDNNTNVKAARQAIVSALASGVRYIAYCGHGNPNSLSFETYYQKSHVESTDYRFFPLAMMSTCDLFSFDRTVNDMGSAFVCKPDGGTAAIIAAGRTVYQDHNQILATATARAICTAGHTDMTGDIFRNAHNAVAAECKRENNTSRAINSLCYNLGGDPALPLYAPACRISISGIGSDRQVTPLTPITVKGIITDSDGSAATWFDGQATVAVYGTPRQADTYPRRGAGSMALTLDEDLIAEIPATVANGEFSIQLIIPEPERITEHIRLSAYAISRSNNDITTATGHVSGIQVASSGDPDSGITDTDAPVIGQMYIDTPDFTDGECVGTNPVLHATILPDATGLHRMASGLGGIRLVLDDRSSFPQINNYLTTEPDGTTMITVPLESMPDGRHTIRLTVPDNAGNTAQRSMSFIVRGETEAALTVDEYPARTKATIHLSHSFPDTPEGRIVIEDANGNTIRTISSPAFPFIWDLRDDNGSRVDDGEYSVYAILRSGKFHGSTGRCSVIVID